MNSIEIPGVVGLLIAAFVALCLGFTMGVGTATNCQREGGTYDAPNMECVK